jgi:hypothetical protein
MRGVYGGLVLLGLLAQTPQASAAILTYTYTGTVSYGSDDSHVFIPADDTSTSLSGKSFTVVETFDTANTSIVNSNGSTFSYQQGGSSRFQPSSGATATISIGGSAPRSFLNDYADSTANNTVPGNPANETRITGSYSGASFYEESLQFDIYSPLLTYDYTKPFSLTTADNAAFSGTYQLSALNPDAFVSANLQPTSVTLTVSQVPLPAALPMFGGALISLAGFGFGLSRRRAGRTSADAA